MEGEWLLAAYFAGWMLVLVSLIPAGRMLLLPGVRLFSAHLLFAAVILADAALFPAVIRGLSSALGTALVLSILSLALRDFWLLAGPGQQLALEVLERLCRDKGIDVERVDGSLVLKRLGTGVRRISLGPWLGLMKMDRRRREPEVDRLGREWARTLFRSPGKP
jgi:hypothetical protein